MRINYIDRIDCLEGMKSIPDNSVDMVLCDLPYGTTQCKWDTVIPFEPLWQQYRRCLKDNGVIALFGAEPFASSLRLSAPDLYRYDWVWRKNKATQYLNANRRPLCDYEVVCIFYNRLPEYHPQMGSGPAYSNKHKPGDSGDCYGAVKYSERNNVTTRYPRCVIDFSVESKPQHPTQKPVELCEYLIKTYTNPGEVVLDNCMGSGTTAVACVRTGRSYIGFELDERYHAIAVQRVSDEIDALLTEI